MARKTSKANQNTTAVKGTQETAPLAAKGEAVQQENQGGDQLPPVKTDGTETKVEGTEPAEPKSETAVQADAKGEILPTEKENEAEKESEPDVTTLKISDEEADDDPENKVDPADIDPEDILDGQEYLEKLAPYLKAYPGEKVFHITSDGQVFLDKNKMEAEAHQRFLDDRQRPHVFLVDKQ